MKYLITQEQVNKLRSYCDINTMTRFDREVEKLEPIEPLTEKQASDMLDSVIAETGVTKGSAMFRMANAVYSAITGEPK